MPTRILIVGAGAIGAFYGSRLATIPNILVSALCRSNYSTVKANGFNITSPKYPDQTFHPEHVFPSPEAARAAQITWDYLLITTKALPDLHDDSELLQGLVSPQTTSIVLIQNGIGIEAPYAIRFPTTSILSAVTIASAEQPQHGIIKHNRWTRINIGPWYPNPDPDHIDTQATQHAATLIALLHEAGIQDATQETHTALQFIRWHKLAINAAMNPSSILSGGSTNQSMTLDPELALHLLGVMHEILDTAPKILGKPFPKEMASPEVILRSTRRNESGSRPSMWGDWVAGRGLELEVILGNPIRLAREKGVEMPRLQSMYALLRAAQGNRDRSREREGEQTRQRREKL